MRCQTDQPLGIQFTRTCRSQNSSFRLPRLRRQWSKHVRGAKPCKPLGALARVRQEGLHAGRSGHGISDFTHRETRLAAILTEWSRGLLVWLVTPVTGVITFIRVQAALDVFSPAFLQSTAIQESVTDSAAVISSPPSGQPRSFPMNAREPVRRHSTCECTLGAGLPLPSRSVADCLVSETCAEAIGMSQRCGVAHPWEAVQH